MRIRVGNDVWDSSVRNASSARSSNFRPIL
jgi:hypothetical protein